MEVYYTTLLWINPSDAVGILYSGRAMYTNNNILTILFMYGYIKPEIDLSPWLKI